METTDRREAPRLYITRHCNTSFNTEGLLQGKQDIPLSEMGRRQAAANIDALAGLGLNRIVSSPLLRARQTAFIYAVDLGIPLLTDERLRELDHGSWEGESVAELLADSTSGYRQWLENPASLAIPQGTEDVSAAQERVLACLVEWANASQPDHVLFVTHKHIWALVECSVMGWGLDRFTSCIHEGVEPVKVPRSWVARVRRDPGG